MKNAFDLTGQRILVTGAAGGIGAIAFLCPAASSYICGAVLDINGGVHMA